MYISVLLCLRIKRKSVKSCVDFTLKFKNWKTCVRIVFGPRIGWKCSDSLYYLKDFTYAKFKDFSKTFRCARKFEVENFWRFVVLKLCIFECKARFWVFQYYKVSEFIPVEYMYSTIYSVNLWVEIAFENFYSLSIRSCVFEFSVL